MHGIALSKTTYLCVGTVVVDPHDLEPTKGRLMVFKVHTDGGRPSLHLVSSTPVQGCVYAIVSKKNTLALSVNSAVCPGSKYIKVEGYSTEYRSVFRSRYSSLWKSREGRTRYMLNW